MHQLCSGSTDGPWMEMNQIPESVCDSIDDGKRPLTSRLTTLLSTDTVLDFLDENIPDDTGLVISTVRKGSWIIEDYVRRRDRSLSNITSNEQLPSGYGSGRIVLFDDSIHSGRTIEGLYRELVDAGDGRIPPGSITVCCIAINADALARLNAAGMDDVRYLRLFKTYEDYVVRDGRQQELTSDCQSFYYSHFIIPYISGLLFNYSPDYESLSISVKNDTSSNLEEIADIVVEALDDILTRVDTLYQDTRVIRRSAELSSEFASRMLGTYYSEPFETDMRKIRVSVVSWNGRAEIVITPIVSYIIKTDADLSDLLVRCSENIIGDVREKVISKLESGGYCILDTREFQADRATGCRQ